MSLVDDIRADVDSILTLRDQIGAVKKPVYFYSRVWLAEKGVGTPTNTFTLIAPSPNIVNMDHSLRVREGGNIKQGDLLLRGMSQQTYPTEAHVDCTVNSALLEKWYCIDGYLYEVVSVVRKYVTWNVLIRKTSKNRVTMP